MGKGHGNRVWVHLTAKKKHPLIQRLQYMKKIGVKPIIGIYAELDEEFSKFLEEELITKFGRKDLGKGPLLNLSDGGEGASGARRSDAHRKSVSNAQKGVPKTEESKRYGKDNHNFGKCLPEETRRKISTIMRGKPKSEEFKNNLRGKKYPDRKLSIVECPYCKKIGASLILRRWHFDRCKLKGDLK